MGMFVVPAWKRLITSRMPGAAYPPITPTNMARKIQSVKKRSRKDSCFTTEACAVI
jgi:hypothetical protein